MLIWVSRTLCGSHKNVPCRFPKTGSVIDWAPQLLGSGIHHCICSEAMFPTCCSKPVTEGNWGMSEFATKTPRCFTKTFLLSTLPNFPSLSPILGSHIYTVVWWLSPPSQVPPSFLSYRHLSKEIKDICHMNSTLASSKKTWANTLHLTTTCSTENH